MKLHATCAMDNDIAKGNSIMYPGYKDKSYRIYSNKTYGPIKRKKFNSEDLWMDATLLKPPLINFELIHFSAILELRGFMMKPLNCSSQFIWAYRQAENETGNGIGNRNGNTTSQLL